ncbi:hypothetical protein [Halalkalibacillus halophilus]|uniref:hypothetical protein n=1 Tax=Halalkalibacillus halophilus TaxID=392827 RepID=UPI000485E3B5|nr:hypothetical protein [Halalkalibacillus halophilus]
MKLFAKILIIVGVVGVLAGVIPILFIYPGYDFSSVLDFLQYTLFEAPERVFWQLGVIVLVIGSLMMKKQKKKGRIFY